MNISSIDVRAMFPENLNHFFRYQGSLTTPPCYESILWTVFDTPITLSHNQVRQTGGLVISQLLRNWSLAVTICFEYYVVQCHMLLLFSAVFRSGNWRVL